LKAKNAELKRSVALAEGQQRVLKQNLSSAESTVRQLKEQAQKLKATVQQVRAQCANDIRKRDTELQKLKTHLSERQRGKREGLGVTTININRTAESTHIPEPDISNPGYNLKQETTEFLTELCQNLSDENDTLINLSRTTIQTLRELQGITDSPDGDASSQLYNQGGAVSAEPTNVIELSAEMDTVLDHLRTLLTNPSFVPLEEVELRDEEILRLREGWERMEVRWKQAVTMMDGWHKRISDGGDSIDIDELRKGMSLDSALGRSIANSNEELPVYDDDNGSEEMQDDDKEEDIAEPQAKIQKSALSKPPIRALGERNGNRKSKSNRKVSFYDGAMDTDAPEPNEQTEQKDNDETVPVKAHTSEAVTQRSSRRPSAQIVSVLFLRPPKIFEHYLTKAFQVHRKSHLSIKDKLAAVEAEAKAAADDATVQDTKKRSRTKRDIAPAKGKGRRRSTLTNDELDQLLRVSK
jgi:Afadin- and alpha -actinin-Binding